MEKYKLYLRYFNKLGIIYSTLLVSITAIILALLLAVIMDLVVTGQLRLLTLIQAGVIAVIIVPVPAFCLFYLLFKVDQERQKIGYFSSVENLDPSNYRGYLIKHAEHELARIRRYGGTASMLIIEVDDMEYIIDQYGYFAGETVLRSIDELLRAQTRSTDLVGRFSSEGLMAFMPTTYCSGAMGAAERIRTMIERMEVDYGKDQIKLTVSIGIAICTYQTEDIDTALVTAEKLLYQAKYLGSNQVVIEQNCSKYCFCFNDVAK